MLTDYERIVPQSVGLEVVETLQLSKKKKDDTNAMIE